MSTTRAHGCGHVSHSRQRVPGDWSLASLRASMSSTRSAARIRRYSTLSSRSATASCLSASLTVWSRQRRTVGYTKTDYDSSDTDDDDRDATAMSKMLMSKRVLRKRSLVNCYDTTKKSFGVLPSALNCGQGAVEYCLWQTSICSLAVLLRTTNCNQFKPIHRRVYPAYQPPREA